MRRIEGILLSCVLVACGGSPPSGAPTAQSDAGSPEPQQSEPEPEPRAEPEPEPRAEPEPEPQLTRTVLLVPGTMIVGSYFDLMAERLVADGFSPVVFETPDLLTETLALGAERIGAKVEQVLAARGEEKLHVVAECNGGVATRYYLQLLGGASRVDQVVTFVSAHHGTWLSPVGDWVSGFQSLNDITPGSPFLAKLNAGPMPAGLALTSIYSCNDELMLPFDTSLVPGATNVLFCQHYLGHLDGFWDDLVYQRIHAALVGEGANAPTSY